MHRFCRERIVHPKLKGAVEMAVKRAILALVYGGFSVDRASREAREPEKNRESDENT